MIKKASILKKLLISLISICLNITVCLNLFACNSPQNQSQTFTTKYTEQQHIQKLTQITESRLSNRFESGEIVGCSVQIVYSFYTSDPEYAIIELEYAEPFESSVNVSRMGKSQYGSLQSVEQEIEYLTKYQHTLIHIHQDRYYQFTGYYKHLHKSYMDGRSPYQVLGYGNNKKYFGCGLFAVDIDGQIVDLYFGYQPFEMPDLFLGEEYWLVDYTVADDFGSPSEQVQKERLKRSRKNDEYLTHLTDRVVVYE